MSAPRAIAFGATLAAALGLGSSASARIVSVGAGEHGDRSRVVLHVDAPDGWRAEPAPRGLVVTLPIADLEIDAPSALMLSLTRRVAGVSAEPTAGGTRILVSFRCDCVGRVEALPGGGLAVDVTELDPIEAAEARADAPFSAETRAIETSQIEGPMPDEALAADIARARQILLEQLRRAADQGIVGADRAAPSDSDAASGGAAAATAVEEATRKVVEDTPTQTAEPAAPSALDRLRALSAGRAPAAEAVAEAAHHGSEPAAHAEAEPAGAAAHGAAPQASGAHDAQTHGAETHGAQTHGADTHGAQSHGAQTHGAQTHGADTHGAQSHGAETHGAQTHGADTDAAAKPDAHASTSPAPARPTIPRGSDPALSAEARESADAERSAALALGGADADCLPDAALDPSAWLSRGDFGAELGKRRAMVYNELNRVSPEGVEDLMRFYIGRGLGVEALALPRHYDVATPATALLTEIATVVEGLQPAPGGPFARLSPCPGRHGLWQAAALAEEAPERAAEAYRRTGRALSRTPEPLRRQLGARIGLAAAMVGDVETAREILTLLKRNLDPADARLAFLRAEVARLDGAQRSARRDYEAIAASRDPLAFHAAIRLSDLLTSARDAERAEALLGALIDGALQHRGGPLAAKLVAAAAQLAARFGDLSRALSEIDRALGRPATLTLGEADALRALRLELIAAESGLMRQSEDAGRTVALVDAVSTLTPGPREDALRLALARHLLETKAVGLARLVLDDGLVARSEEAALLRARAETPPGGVDGAPAASLTGGVFGVDFRPEDFEVVGDRGAPAPTAPAEGAAPEPTPEERRAARLQALSEPADAFERAAAAEADGDPERRLAPTPLLRGEALLRALEQDLRLIEEVATDG